MSTILFFLNKQIREINLIFISVKSLGMLNFESFPINKPTNVGLVDKK